MPNILTAIVAQSRRDFNVGLEEEFFCGHTSLFFFLNWDSLHARVNNHYKT